MAGALGDAAGYPSSYALRCTGARVRVDPIRPAKETIEEMLYGKAELRRRERQAELAHERELASVRTQSHAIIWLASMEELRATIARWFELGWIDADSLPDAMQKASIHFRRPDGAGVIFPTALPATASTPEATREALIRPLLDERGWSIFDWANEANVAHATAIDYFHGKTKPQPHTRRKLAKALGIPVQQLPR